MQHYLQALAAAVIFGGQAVLADFDLGYGDDSDLTSFVSRPEIRAPRFNVSVYYPQEVQPGYWFTAPYAYISQQSHAKRYLQACQTGPAIYDQNGELVWSGACEFRNQNAADFRAWRANGTDFLSTMLYIWKDVEDDKGHGVILDNAFNVIREVHVPKTMATSNMHELNIINDGRNALYFTRRTPVMDMNPYEREFTTEAGLIGDIGFHEVDLTTGEILVEWWSTDHISLDESTAVISNLNGPWPLGWNWIHFNSIDKNSAGDYLLSARYTDGIYKVSGKDGSILWTLSGRPNSTFSTFTLEDGFNFSRQHDARFLSEDNTTEVITFLDNAGDEIIQTSNYSSSLVVTLDKVAMSANVTRRWVRPGNKRSLARGNFQLLPNKNAFTGWSDNSHISEHSWDGKLLMEAEFSSKRFVTYRTWKAIFTGIPSRPPDMKAFVFGIDIQTCITVCYVSWNGATEVSQWAFYRSLDGEEQLIGTRARTGFETMFQAVGYERTIVAKAIAADGSVLGQSDTYFTIVPDQFGSSHPDGETMYPGKTEALASTREEIVDELGQEPLRNSAESPENGIPAGSLKTEL